MGGEEIDYRWGIPFATNYSRWLILYRVAPSMIEVIETLAKKHLRFGYRPNRAAPLESPRALTRLEQTPQCGDTPQSHLHRDAVIRSLIDLP